MDWASFVVGHFFGFVLFGATGVVLGWLLRGERNTSARSQIGDILEYGRALPEGDVVVFTVGHDVTFKNDDDDGDEGAEDPILPGQGWGRG